MKKRNLFVSVLFIVILVYVCLNVIFIKPQITNLPMEGRVATKFIGPSYQSIKDGTFQSTFENAMTDQFIKREDFLKLYYRYEHLLYKNSILNKQAYSLIKIGDNVYTFDAGGDYLLEFPMFKSDKIEQGIINISNSINDISKKYPNINMYVYKPLRLNESDIFNIDNNFLSYGSIYEELFIDSLNENIQYNSNGFTNLNDYKNKYYMTDPHWNNIGADEGYRQIVDMFNVNYNDMEYVTYESEYCFNDFDYYGQYGRSSAYQTKADTFCDYNYNLNDYKTIVNGTEMKYDLKEEFKDNSVDPYSWNFMYSMYHGNDEAEIIFDFNQDLGRNLLVFTDSYGGPIKNLLASHFDKTYYIDPRINDNFILNDYIIQNEITDILYLGFFGSLYNTPKFVIPN